MLHLCYIYGFIILNYWWNSKGMTQYHMHFDVRESSDIELSLQHICWQFFLKNVSLLRSISSLKIDFFLLSYTCFFKFFHFPGAELDKRREGKGGHVIKVTCSWAWRTAALVVYILSVEMVQQKRILIPFLL